MTSDSPDDYLLISGIQHFTFCRRQWALIVLEQQWADNSRTVEGELMHKNAHDDKLRQQRGDMLIVRGLRVISHALKLTGACDVVEFHADPEGIKLSGHRGTWIPYPVEYKRGRPKSHDADELQLCAQAMCLEEMLCCGVPEGSLYYGQTNRRQQVEFTAELRGRVKDVAAEMYALYARGYTPRVKTGKFCQACSLKEVCLPGLCKPHSGVEYMRAHLED